MNTNEKARPDPGRRRALRLALSLGGLAVPGLAGAVAARVQVWKGPACGCCTDWIRHLQAQGFQVDVTEGGNTQARKWLGIPLALGSCHTALVGGYALEGHVPDREIRRLLQERPQALGLAVPGMPIGSPGMDGPDYGHRQDPYEVLLLLKDGSTRVYQSYR